MSCERKLTVLILLLATQSAAFAAPITSYAMASISLRDCVVACFQGDSVPIVNVIEEDYGEQGLAQLYVDGNAAGNNSGASAGFSGNAYAPALSAYANTSSSKHQFATATFGLQRYEFTAPGTVTIGGQLTYSQSGTNLGAPGGSTDGRIAAGLYSFQMTNNVFDLDDCTALPTFVFGKTARICSINTQNSPMAANGNTGVYMAGQYNFNQVLFPTGASPVADGELTANLSITGNTGDVYFIGAHLYAFSHFDGFADSRNTLRLNIDKPFLVSASFARDTFVPAPLPASVPEPTSLALLVSSVVLLFLRRKTCSLPH